MFVSVCVSVCLSVHEDISRTIHAIFTNFFVHVAYVRGSSSDMFMIGRIACLQEGFLPYCYRLGKGDGSAKCRRSMLSMVAVVLCGLVYGH